MIIFGITSYSSSVDRWLVTLRQHYDGHAILVLTDHPEVIKTIEDRFNVEVWYRPEPASFWSSNGFCIPLWKYVKEVANKYPNEWLLRTDVWDVVFQADPRTVLNIVATDTIYIHSEEVKNNDCVMVKWVQDSPYKRELVNMGYYLTNCMCAGTQLMVGSKFIEAADFILANTFKSHTDQPLWNIWILQTKPKTKFIRGFMEVLWGKDLRVDCGKFYTSNTLITVAHAGPPAGEKLLEEVYPVRNYRAIELYQREEPKKMSYVLDVDAVLRGVMAQKRAASVKLNTIMDFDEVVYISLDSRSDRRDAMWDNIADCQWPFKIPKRFRGIKADTMPFGWQGSLGAVGAAMSHMAVCKKALDENKLVLVLEDDVLLPKDFGTQALKFLKSVPDDWEGLMFGGASAVGKDISPGVIKLRFAVCLHCYILRGNLLKQFCVPDSTPIDIKLAYRLMPIHKIYAPTTFIAGQRTSYSDIEGKERVEFFGDKRRE